MPLKFQTRPSPHHRTRLAGAIAPPGPAPVRIVGLDRTGQMKLAFTFDTLLIDPASCGDLRVQGIGPDSAVQTGDYSLEATYPAMTNGDVWSTATLDNEPTFEDDAPLAPDGGVVPDWF